MRLKRFLRVFIILLVFGFLVKYFFLSSNGFLHYMTVKKNVEKEMHKLVRLESKINNLEVEINKLASDEFEVQKIAREDLQMGFRDEKVYLLMQK